VNIVRDNMLDGGWLSFKPTAPLNMISVGKGGQDSASQEARQGNLYVLLC